MSFCRWFHRQEINTLQSNIDYLRNKVEDKSIDQIKNTDDQLKYEPNFINNQGNFSTVGSNSFLYKYIEKLQEAAIRVEK